MRHASRYWFLIGVSLSLFLVSGNNATASTKRVAKTFLDEPQEIHKAWVVLKEKNPQQVRRHASDSAPKERATIDRNRAAWLTCPVSAAHRETLVRLGAHERAVSNWFNAVSVEATGEQLQKIAELPFVKQVAQLRTSVPRRLPSDRAAEESPRMFWMEPADALDYGPSRAQLEQVGVPELLEEGWSGAGVTVALLDVGFKWTHEAFEASISQGRLLGQWDFVMGDGNVERDPSDPYDYSDEHGTMTWSVLGGYAPGQIIGPAYGASFLLGRTEDSRSETPAEEDFWIAGLEWAVENGADIVSSSLGYRDLDGEEYDHQYEELDGATLPISLAANYAAEMGVLVVNSMGNEGPFDRTLSAPADAFGALAVGAVNRRRGLAILSSRGPAADGRIKPDVVAWGVDNHLATNRGYGQASGTSFSAPLVAGTAALLWEMHPEWSVEDLRAALTSTADRSDNPDNAYGYGLINALRAEAYLPEEPAFVADITKPAL